MISAEMITLLLLCCRHSLTAVSSAFRHLESFLDLFFFLLFSPFLVFLRYHLQVKDLPRGSVLSIVDFPSSARISINLGHAHTVLLLLLYFLRLEGGCISLQILSVLYISVRS